MQNEHKIVIHKSARRLELFIGSTLSKSYDIALGPSPIGDKQVEGDGKTPEGRYHVFAKNPESKFHLSLGLSYPSREDADRGLKNGLISQEDNDAIYSAIARMRMPPQKTRLGGEIYIHGGGTEGDWTQGCVGLENADIAELFDAVPIGTPVTIRP